MARTVARARCSESSSCLFAHPERSRLEGDTPRNVVLVNVHGPLASDIASARCISRAPGGSGPQASVLHFGVVARGLLRSPARTRRWRRRPCGPAEPEGRHRALPESGKGKRHRTSGKLPLLQWSCHNAFGRAKSAPARHGL